MSQKNAKYKIKNDLNEYEVIHFETNTDQVLFNTDQLTVNKVGGIDVGEDLNNMSIKEILIKLLYTK